MNLMGRLLGWWHRHVRELFCDHGVSFSATCYDCDAAAREAGL